MHPANHHRYKALYLECAKKCEDQASLIAALQQQLMQLAGERQTLRENIAYQTEQLLTQANRISEQQELTRQQRQTILAQAEKLAQLQTITSEQNCLIAQQQKELDKNKRALVRLDTLRFELATIKKWMFGIRSEKRHQPSEADKPGAQLVLDMEVDTWGVCQVSDRRRVPEHLRVIKSIVPAKRGGRQDFPTGLEEQIVILDAPGKPEGARCMGHVDQRQLACDPMRWYIKVTRRLVYLAPADQDRLHFKQLIAPLPPHPIARCKMDVSVLVMLTVEKFLYHMPVWRQQKRLQQYGIHLPYSSLSSLVNRTCEALEPLWHLLLKEITSSGLMNMDETRYRVLDESKKQGKKSHIGWMWSCLNPVQGIVCFLYQRGRGRKDIHSVLDGYKGFLMTDAYGAYTQYGRQPGVTHLHCLAHARRYFTYALAFDGRRAAYALDHFFGPLYDIEQESKGLELDYDGITAKRQAESLPILQALRQWMEAEMPKTIPGTPLYKAIHYSLSNHSALVKYTTDGMLPIDNNQLEGQIRSIALGRHNHLFAGSYRGGELAAIMYSFLATCKLQKTNPTQWLDDVLRRIATQPQERLSELLPQFWKPLVPAKVQSA
jgi:hypothetical protein